MQYDLIHGEGEFTIDGHLLHHSCFNINWLTSPRVIFDVGGYDFGDAIRFKKQWPECSVYSFELDSNNFKKFAPFAISQQVIVSNIGITDQVGEFDYWQSQHSGGVNAQSTLLEPNQNYKNNYSHIVNHSIQQKANCQRLDYFCNYMGIQEIDLLHEDTEGNLYQVLKGLGDIRPKMIYGEFLIDGGWNLSKSFKETLDLLDRMGYNCVAEFAHDKLFILRELV